MPLGVRVEGLRELRMALGVVEGELSQELRDELKVLAVEVRLEAARRLEADVAHPTGRAAASLRAYSTSRAAGVRAGSASVPYYGWLDFGGTIRHMGSRHTHTRAHLIRRQFIAGGRYLYPAADAKAALIAPKVEALLDRLFIRAGFTD